MSSLQLLVVFVLLFFLSCCHVLEYKVNLHLVVGSMVLAKIAFVFLVVALAIVKPLVLFKCDKLESALSVRLDVICLHGHCGILRVRIYFLLYPLRC